MRCFSVQLIPPVHLFKQKKKQQKKYKKTAQQQTPRSSSSKKVERKKKQETKRKNKIIIKILTFLMLCISLPIKMRKKQALMVTWYFALCLT